MSLTLDSTLQTAQDGVTRRPIIQLKSQRFADLLPLRGNDFGLRGRVIDNFYYDGPYRPDLICHSSGRLCMTHRYEWSWRIDSTTTGYLYEKDWYWYTDVNREQWYQVAIDADDMDTDYHYRLVELTSGDIGVLRWDTDGLGGLTRTIIDVTGSQFPGESWTTITGAGVKISGADAAMNANGETVFVWAHWNSGTMSLWTCKSLDDWVTTSSAYDITPGSLDTGYPIKHISLTLLPDDDMLMSFAYGDILEDGVYGYNIYTMVSVSGGLSWAAPTKVTSYTDLSLMGVHPEVVTKSDGTVVMLYNEQQSYKYMGSDVSGWPSSCDEYDSWRSFHYNPANDRLYGLIGNTGMGAKGYCGVVIVDPATWTIERVYDQSSVPSIDPCFANNTFLTTCHGSEGYHCVFAVENHICFIDDSVRTLKEYHFYGGCTTGANLNGFENLHGGAYIGSGGIVEHHLDGIYYDYENGKIWCSLSNTYLYSAGMILGWIDVTEAPDIDGKYTFHQLNSSQYRSEGYPYGTFGAQDVCSGYKTLIPVEEKGWIVLAIDPKLSYAGELHIYSIETGAQIKAYSYEAGFSLFPHSGIWTPFYHSDFIYGSFSYYSGQPELRGIIKIDPSTDTFNYLIPPWSVGEHITYTGFRVKDDDRVWLATSLGPCVYDLANDLWTRFSKDEVVGLPDDGICTCIDYDDITGNVYCGGFGEWGGVYLFNESGWLRSTLYEETTGGGGVWVFPSFSLLIYGSNNFEAVAAIDEDDMLWVVWTHYDVPNDIYRLYWDNLEPDFDLSSDLTLDPLSVEWDVENPTVLNFVLSRGHLYDPQNDTSLFSVYVEKGRKLFLKIGENVEGIPYYQDQGTFIVTGSTLTYQVNDYPIINVTAQDSRVIWENHRMIASEYYANQTPKAIIEDLLNDHTFMSSSDHDIPTFDDSHNITHQFIDTLLLEAIKQVGDHFFYVLFFDVNGILTMKKVDLEKDVDHPYEDTLYLLNYSPDDSFSTFTNRITVIGETDNYTTVIYAEELIEQISGTVGWWGGEEEKTVYYSKDLSRQCKQPRLAIVTSVSEFKFFISGGGGTEYLSYEDPDELYCIITIECPDMVWLLAGYILNLLAAGGLALFFCQFSVGYVANYSPCGIFVFLISLYTSLISSLLAAVATYSYEIYARPVGHEKQSVSGTANDLDLQIKLNGQIVAENIEDSFCYNAGECERVAEGELAIIKAQRSRVSLRKVAHLQDELLDMISLPHPYGANTIKILITKLRREIIRPSKDSISSDAGVFDTIEGWKIQ